MQTIVTPVDRIRRGPTRSRREPTPAQRDAAKARRDRFRVLAKSVADMTPDARQAFANDNGLLRTVQDRALSVFNTCLVYSQFPSATLVGGFQQWRKAGRCVRKGEHGAMIWVPIGKPRENPDGADFGKRDDDARPGFIVGTVFDVSQTDETGASESEDNSDA